MKSFEIPYVPNRDKIYRFFEMLPGIMSWSAFLTLILLSILAPSITAYLVIAYILTWFIRALSLNVRVIQGFKKLQNHSKIDWQKKIIELDDPKKHLENYSKNNKAVENWHLANLYYRTNNPSNYKSTEILNAVIVALYSEPLEVIEPTIKTIIKSKYNLKNIILIIAYEERGGKKAQQTSEYLVKKYGSKFSYATAIGHPDGIRGEVRGKGGNITFAGYRLQEYLDSQGIDYRRVIVTTLDCDNRPHLSYFASLTYAFIACPKPLNTSFQPIAMYLNNIWDAPAPMRVIATGNSFWNILVTMRPHVLRNFSAHSQGMEALVKTNFWSVRTIVEDGHQFWRTYFALDGDHEVHPIFLPIYQDAVLSSGYVRTLKAQFVQVRRWAWGASDLAYIFHTGFRKKNKVPKLDLTFKLFRHLETHISWATAPILLIAAPLGPLYLNSHANDNIVIAQLPTISSQIQTLAMFGILMTLYVSMKTLPPRPKRYKSHRTLFMILQWVYLPLTSIVYSSSAALYSQTRLMFGKYMGQFDLTEKVVKK